MGLSAALSRALFATLLLICINLDAAAGSLHPLTSDSWTPVSADCLQMPSAKAFRQDQKQTRSKLSWPRLIQHLMKMRKTATTHPLTCTGAKPTRGSQLWGSGSRKWWVTCRKRLMLKMMTSRDLSTWTPGQERTTMKTSTVRDRAVWCPLSSAHWQLAEVACHLKQQLWLRHRRNMNCMQLMQLLMLVL